MTDFGIEDFHKIIDQAVSWIDTQEGKIDAEVRAALQDRLIFRREFLDALDQDLDVMQSRSTEHFSSSLSKVALIEKSISLGKAVPDAFSLKIQRKLASTVPPRPMVKISHEDALGHLRRFCRDAIDIQEILDYCGPENLRVRGAAENVTSVFELTYSGIPLDIGISKATTICLHPVPSSDLHRQRYEGLRLYPRQAIFL